MFIAVPAFLNKECRMNIDFHLTFVYIPNLSYGTGKSSRKKARSKLQDEHICLRLITKQLKEIRESGNFFVTVFGRTVEIFVWIHQINGDISGQNDVTGSFNSSNTNFK